MGWHGIQNLPPGFDVTGGKGKGVSIVDQVIKGDIPGLSPAQRDAFKDLKRHLLHQDYARFFETSLACAALLIDIPERGYAPTVMKDIIEPAIQVALDQFESIRKEVARYAASKRKMEYDPVSSLNQMYTKARPLALAYPTAAGADKIEGAYRAVLKEVEPAASDGPAPRAPSHQ
jgi:hypothetical protein